MHSAEPETTANGGENVHTSQRDLSNSHKTSPINNIITPKHHIHRGGMVLSSISSVTSGDKCTTDVNSVDSPLCSEYTHRASVTSNSILSASGGVPLESGDTCGNQSYDSIVGHVADLKAEGLEFKIPVMSKHTITRQPTPITRDKIGMKNSMEQFTQTCLREIEMYDSDTVSNSSSSSSSASTYRNICPKGISANMLVDALKDNRIIDRLSADLISSENYKVFTLGTESLNNSSSEPLLQNEIQKSSFSSFGMRSSIETRPPSMDNIKSPGSGKSSPLPSFNVNNTDHKNATPCESNISLQHAREFVKAHLKAIALEAKQQEDIKRQKEQSQKKWRIFSAFWRGNGNNEKNNEVDNNAWKEQYMKEKKKNDRKKSKEYVKAPFSNARLRFLQRTPPFMIEQEYFFLLATLSVFEILLETLLAPLMVLPYIFTSMTLCFPSFSKSTSSSSSSESPSCCRKRRAVSLVLMTIYVVFGLFGITILEHFEENMLYSSIYHYIRASSTIKLYVMFTMLELADKLFSALGTDLSESVFEIFSSYYSLSTDSKKKTSSYSFVEMGAFFIAATVCHALHAIILLLHVATINVAINSEGSSLIGLLISNNFVELKSVVFKKYTVEALFTVALTDVVERVQHFVFIFAMLLLHIQTEGLGSLQISEILLIFGCEKVIDFLKHLYVVRFNCLSIRVYRSFTECLMLDIGLRGALCDIDLPVVNHRGEQLFLLGDSSAMFEAASSRSGKREREVTYDGRARADGYESKSPMVRENCYNTQNRQNRTTSKSNAKSQRVPRTVSFYSPPYFIPNPARRAAFPPFPYISLLLWAAWPLAKTMFIVNPCYIAVLVALAFAVKGLLSTFINGVVYRYICRNLLRKPANRDDKEREVFVKENCVESTRISSSDAGKSTRTVKVTLRKLWPIWLTKKTALFKRRSSSLDNPCQSLQESVNNNSNKGPEGGITKESAGAETNQNEDRFPGTQIEGVSPKAGENRTRTKFKLEDFHKRSRSCSYLNVFCSGLPTTINRAQDSPNSSSFHIDNSAHLYDNPSTASKMTRSFDSPKIIGGADATKSPMTPRNRNCSPWDKRSGQVKNAVPSDMVYTVAGYQIVIDPVLESLLIVDRFNVVAGKK